MTEPVLLIDAHDDVREGLTVILEANGWTVVTARDGREALNKIAGGLRPCIILLDLMSPVMNGLEFRSELSQRPQLLPIPIVAYSGLRDVREQAQQFASDKETELSAEIGRLMAAVRQNC
jgi:CheY-like chemotaxis protein